MRTKSHHRQDFIELLFPIAIGTGFAEHVAGILLHRSYDRTPDHQLILGKLLAGSGYEIALLCLSMMVVVWSWNWYVPRIREHTLDSTRFTIDIFILAMYLVLLVGSWLYDVWFWTLAVIWWLYFAWDVALFRYSRIRQIPVQTRSRFVMALAWALLATLLALLHRVLTPIGAGLGLVSAIAVVVLYRWDQRSNWNLTTRIAALIFTLGCILLGFYYG